MSKCENLIQRFNEISKSLVGSASSLDKLLKASKKYLYSDNIEFKQIDDSSWSVHNKDGELVQWIVKKVKNRFRLESSGKEPVKRKSTWGDGEQSGTVTNITKDQITIKGDDGEEYITQGTNSKVGKTVNFRYNKFGFAQIK